MSPLSLTIATRGSPLALWQADHVAGLISAAHPEITIKTLVIKTKGDRILDRPLAEIGGKGLFVKEIEDAILSGEADIAVHSMKDVPMHLPKGLCIGVMPKRGSVEDVFLSHTHPTPESLPPGSKLGSSSPRRKAQALLLRPDIEIAPLRGNIATRLEKLAKKEFDAIILAKAGLERLGLSAPYMFELNKHNFIPAAGQGALGVEFSENRADLRALLVHIDDPQTHACVKAERAFIRELEADCYAPVAAYAWMGDENTLYLRGLLANETGTCYVTGVKTGSRPEELGSALANQLQKEACGKRFSC